MKSKKEIINAYKEIKLKIGVYQIKNAVNNKVFIGSSIDLIAIWNRHQFQLNNGLHLNSNLQKEWNDFGPENFIYEILSEIKQNNTKTIDYRKEAKQLEAMFIEEMEPFNDKGYNIKT